MLRNGTKIDKKDRPICLKRETKNNREIIVHNIYVETLNKGKPQATNNHYILDIQERTNYNTLCTYCINQARLLVSSITQL